MKRVHDAGQPDDEDLLRRTHARLQRHPSRRAVSSERGIDAGLSRCTTDTDAKGKAVEDAAKSDWIRDLLTSA